MADYTEAEALAAIKEIDAAIAELRRNPNQQSIDGNFVSFAGKMAELQRERQVWSLRLKQARFEGASRHPLQGPDFEV